MPRHPLGQAAQHLEKRGLTRNGAKLSSGMKKGVLSKAYSSPQQVRTEWRRKDWRGSDHPQIHPPPANCQVLHDPPEGQTLNTAKRGLQQRHCREAGQHTSKNFQKLFPHPRVGLLRPSEKRQGLKHVGRWLLQAYCMEACKDRAVATQRIPLSKSGVSWSSHGTFLHPCLSSLEGLGSGVRGEERQRATCPSLRELVPRFCSSLFHTFSSLCSNLQGQKLSSVSREFF